MEQPMEQPMEQLSLLYDLDRGAISKREYLFFFLLEPLPRLAFSVNRRVGTVVPWVVPWVVP